MEPTLGSNSRGMAKENTVSVYAEFLVGKCMSVEIIILQALTESQKDNSHISLKLKSWMYKWDKTRETRGLEEGVETKKGESSQV